MWLLVGVTVLLSRAVMANLTDESVYYLSETNDDRSSLDNVDNKPPPGYEKSELENSDARSSSSETDEEQQSEIDSIADHGAKRSVTDTESRDKSSGQRQAPAPLATLLYWPEREDQVLGMEQRRNPLMQERRNPAFSPWGGKRDVQPRIKTITKIRRPVRVPFNSWGGKRDGERLHQQQQQRAFSDLKRAKFFHWAGKKNPSFNNWADKNSASRIIDDPSTNYHYYQRHRKSSVVDVDQHQVDDDLDSTDDLSGNNEPGEKRGSLKLTSSGELTTSGSTSGEKFLRVPFEPWGGKKRRLLEYSNDASRSASVSLILRKIGQLIPSNA